MNLNTLQTGNLVIQALDEKLVISTNGGGNFSTDISFDDLPIILEFLHTQGKLQMNRRKGFRLNFSELRPADRSSFALTVTTDRACFVLDPIDFSLGGIFAESALYVGDQGEFVVMTLAYGGNTILLPAEIVRISECGTQFAFHFKNVVGPDGKLDPPEDLAGMFASLEACWLGSSLDLQWN